MPTKRCNNNNHEECISFYCDCQCHKETDITTKPQFKEREQELDSLLDRSEKLLEKIQLEKDSKQ